MGGIHSKRFKRKRNRAHSRGPLDGSLYAKVNKNKKSEDVDTNHVTEDPPQESTNSNLEEQISLTNHTSEEKESTNQKSPNVVVVNGNRIIYKPPPELGESAPSLSSVTVTSSPTTIKSVPRVDTVINSGNMADASIQQTATRIVDDVIKKSALTKVGNDVTKLNARYSEISSCSATTLSSTTTEEGGAPQAELSDHDTSSESSFSDLDGNLSPSTVKGNISPEILLEQALGDTEESETPLFVGAEAEKTEIEQPVPQIEPSLKEASVETLPPPAVPPPAVPTNPAGSPTQEVMYNGINGSYNKGPEYAVPMRDMKITTIPSKRAVLVSTGNDDMAAQTSERRDSVYDDGNAYSGLGYSAIEEYPGAQSIQTKTPSNDEHSYIPEDVQELLNGLQEGTTSSDIDSGFHGSSMALPQSKSPQSSSEFSDPFGSPPPSQSNGLSPTFDESYPMGKMTSPTVATVQHASVAMNHNYQTSAVSDLNVQGVATTTPTKKNVNPGVPIPTQTAPEPQPAKVQIITMRNVYTNSEGIPLYPKEEVNSVPYATKQHTQPSPVEYKYHQEAAKTSPAVATDNYMETVTMRTKTAPVETVTMRTKKESATSPIKSAATPGKFEMRNNHVTTNTVAMTTGDATMDLYYDDEIEDKLDTENIKSVEEQISHAQQHLLFLKEQQEKLVKRKQDRTKYREKRNSSVFDRNSQGYNMSPGVSATLPRQPYIPAEEVPPPVAAKSQTLQRSMAPVLPQHIDNKMPPIGNINQRVVAAPVQQQQAPPPIQNAWNASGPKLSRQASDSSHNRNGPVVVQPSLPEKKSAQPIRGQSKADIIMSDDLQEQLAELDRCIAELTMDIPSLEPEPQKPEEPPVVLRQRSYTLDAARKMETNVPQTNSNGGTPVPNPPTRSRSSFDSYKRLSQDFDLNKLKSPTDQGGNDDVFSPGPQVPRKKKQQSSFPPQTSVTRRQNMAPAPPPKRRISIEERLSPELFQALAHNPGAKPKENIHSYKEDLAPENPPDTPTFPLSPATPYTNNDSPSPVSPAGQVKSPVVFMKTPLSALHLQPTDKPMKSLHHVEIPNEPPASPSQEDVVDGKMPTPNGKQSPVIEPAIQAAVALQNGHAKETALLSDESETSPKPDPVAPKQTEKIVQPQNIPNGRNHIARPAVENMLGVKVAEVQRQSPVQQSPTPPSNLDLPQTNNYTPTNLHGIPQQIQNQQQPTTPQQNLLNHSGTPQSSHSHSPAATSSNSRHGSSDSLDGPSTRHSNSSVLSSSSSSSAHVLHPGMGMMTPNNVMRPGSQLSNYDRHLLPPGSASGHRSGDESFGSPQSGRTSSSSISDVEKMNYDVSHATISAAPKFIRDTTAYWYKPDIAREQALAILRSKQAGSFVVRDSRCFPGAFGLALKVDKLPPNVQSKPGADIANEYVRHFLIEPSSRGVKLKGCQNEPVFGSLSALVYQHSITALALPCRLIIPTADQEIPQPGNTPRQSPAAETPPPVAAASPANAAVELLKQGAACNVIYLGTVDTESLTGPPAIERAIRETFQNAKTNPNMTSIVHFKVSPQGITLTDNARKLFFRRHYSTDTVTFCGLDPLGGANKAKPRRWDATNMRGGPEAWLFGFVARKQAGSRDNACHVFAELDSAQPARAIVNFVMKVLIGSTRQNSS